MVSVHQVADCFIRQAHEVGDPITNLKLQKLVYYAQAWYATLNRGKPLFAEPFEAWVHGPVCPPLYQRFKAYSYRAIDEDIKHRPDLPAGVCTHLEEVMQVYGGFSAYDLERMTHNEAPWLEARGDLAATDRCSREIPVAAMVAYYGKILKQHGAEKQKA